MKPEKLEILQNFNYVPVGGSVGKPMIQGNIQVVDDAAEGQIDAWVERKLARRVE